MAEGNDTLATKALPYRSYRFVTDEAIPIEQRTDVTVDELERMSLPCTAELYDGRIVLKEANMEIISPDDKFEAMMEKVDEYIEAGVPSVWLVFSTKREILVCTASSTYRRVRDVLTAPELLPGFELPVSRIFEGIPLPENS